MPALLLYLLKVNVALLLFYLAYHLVLRRLTFYHLNRKFLLFGILFSTLYPFIDISPLLEKHQELPLPSIATVPVWVTTTQAAAPTPAFDYWQLPVWLFWLGAGVMAVRLVLQFVSLYKIHAASVPDSHKGISFRKVWSITQAFSFWQNIYLNPTQHRQEELESILRHELVHVREWHTLDVLLAEVSAVFYWFNPGAWLMKKGIKENLEFIADQDVVRAGADKKEYQYLLLKATGATEPQLALPFSFPSLKRRIAMLNKMPTKKANRLRLLVVLPIVAVLLLAFRSASQSVDFNEQEELVLTTDFNPQTGDVREEHKAFYKRNPGVRKVFWKSKNEIVVRLETEEEVYRLDDKKSMAAAEKKYGKFPSAPLPAKVITEKEANSKLGLEELPNGEKIIIPADFNYYQDRNNLPVNYTNFLKQNPSVAKVGWRMHDKEGIKSIVIYLKSGATEHFDIKNSNNMAAAEAKYGQLPNMLPPAPPVVVASVVESRPARQSDPIFIPGKSDEPAGLKAFLSRNPQIKQVGWKGSKKNVLVIFLNSGATEMYNLLDEKSRYAAEQKYGKLPVLSPAPAPAPNAPLAPPVPASAKLIDSDKIIAYIFNPDNYSEDEFVAAQKLFSKHGYQLKFNNQYKGKELTQLRLSVNDKRGSLTGNYDVQELKASNEVVVLEIDKIRKMMGIASQPATPPAPELKEKLPAQSAPEKGKIQISIELRGDVPRFTGDGAALSEYLSKSIKYPKAAIDKRLQGTVEVEFTVEKDGSITNKKVTAPHDALAFQIFNALDKMPKWLPAEASDPKPVFVYRFRTEFKLIEK